MTGRSCRPALAVAVSLLVFGHSRATAQAPEDLTAARRLVGMWRLVDRTVSFADGASRPDPRTTAYIFYSDTGVNATEGPSSTTWRSSAFRI